MRHRPLCAVCDYDLTAVPTDTCPECGTQFEVSVHAAASPHPRGLSRIIAGALALAAIVFCLAQTSHGSFMFWWSVESALLVFFCTPLLLAVTVGPSAVSSAFRTLAIRTADARPNSHAAATFRLAATISLFMGALGVTLGLIGALASASDLGATGHSLAIALCSLLYALFVAIPAFLSAACLARRTDECHASHYATTTRRSLKLAAGASIAATLLAAASLGVILWSVQS